MNGFEKRRLQKMEQIIQAAFSLFSKYGIQKVSMKEIANKANVSQVSIYNYFGNKDELLFEVTRFYLNDKVNAYREMLENPMLSFKEKMSRLLEMKLKDATNVHEDFLKPIISSPSPKLQQLLADFAIKESLPMIQSFLQEGKDCGQINQSYSTETIVLIVQIFSEGIRKFPEVYTGINSGERIKEIMEFFFYGLFGQAEKKDKL